MRFAIPGERMTVSCRTAREIKFSSPFVADEVSSIITETNSLLSNGRKSPKIIARNLYTHNRFFPELSFIFMILLWNKNLLIVFVSWPNLV